MRYLFNKKNRLYLALLLSLLLHVLALYLPLSGPSKLAQTKQPRKTFDFTLDEKTMQQFANRRKLQAQKQKPAPTHERKQIVNNEITGKEERPTDTRFLGEKDQKFAKQSVAKDIGQFQKAGNGKTLTEAKAITKTEAKSQAKPPKESPTNKTPPPKLALGDLGIGNYAPPKLNQKEPPPAPKVEAGTKEGTGPEGIAKNNDFIEDVPPGDLTHLNTIQFK